MKVVFSWFAIFLCFGSVAFGAKEFEPRKEGLYAVIQTSKGRIVAQLFFEQAPRTVANFVALAEGTGAWFDIEAGEVVRRPFFDGVTFHRVLPEGLIQTGSRNGLGNDGPGYWFEDEFDPKLKHNRSGILSMANRGPNTNGSQFFITLESMSYLNGKHSVFGRVVSGITVVRNISEVRSEDERPQKPVVIEGVRIIRHGAAAEAFEPADYAFPEPSAEAVLAGED